MPQSSSTCGPSRPLVPLWTQLHKDTKGVVGLPWAAPPGFPGSDHWNCLHLAHVIWGWGRQTRVKKKCNKNWSISPFAQESTRELLTNIPPPACGMYLLAGKK